MKIAVFAAVCASLLLSTDAASTKSKDQPGWCSTNADCEKQAKGYVCVSVQTTRKGTEQVKQCLPKKTESDICAGIVPGLCPSFSTWSTNFKSISSVCAYIVPEKGTKCLKDGDSGVSGSGSTAVSKGGVSCLQVENEDGESTGVIYGCVDFDGSRLLFKEKSPADKVAKKMNYTAIIKDGCVNPKNEAGSDVVCSGRGTCTPKTKSQMDYECRCNVGYSGVYCQKIESNKCTMKAQCAAGTCNLDKQECECEKGTSGPQCSECDTTSADACNKQGTCSASSGNATCTCNEGYSGAQCDRKVAGKQPVKSAGSADVDGSVGADGSKKSDASRIVSTLALVASSLVVAALW